MWLICFLVPHRTQTFQFVSTSLLVPIAITTPAWGSPSRCGAAGRSKRPIGPAACSPPPLLSFETCCGWETISWCVFSACVTGRHLRSPFAFFISFGFFGVVRFCAKCECGRDVAARFQIRGRHYVWRIAVMYRQIYRENVKSRPYLYLFEIS